MMSADPRGQDGQGVVLKHGAQDEGDKLKSNVGLTCRVLRDLRRIISLFFS